MKGLLNTFKNISLGGVLFLIPITIAVLVIVEAIGFLELVAEPMAEFLPTDTILGFGLAQILAVLFLLILCFVAGLIARAAIGQNMIEKIERGLMVALPGYGAIKGFSNQILQSHDKAEHFIPVTARFEGGVRPAFEVERLPSGEVVVFLPGAPNAWSGWVVYLDPEQVEPLDMRATDLLATLEGLGMGSGRYSRPRAE